MSCSCHPKAAALLGMGFEQGPELPCIGWLAAASADSKPHPCPVVIKSVATMHLACPATKLVVRHKLSSERLMAALA